MKSFERISAGVAGGRGSAESRFSLLDQIPLGVCVLNRQLEVRFWNACLESWTGLSRHLLLGRDLSERFPHLREPRYFPRLVTVLEGGPPAIFSSQLHRYFIPARLPDGSLRIQHTVVTPIPGAGEEEPRVDAALAGGTFLDGPCEGLACDALISIQDVTDLTRGLEERRRAEEERRRLEAQILHTQKLESLGVLAGGIAHDFNNLLVGILGNADLLLRQLPRGLGARPQLESVVVAARRAADLARQMLAYSGKGKLVTRILDLTGSVEDATALIEASISKKARVDCHLAEGLPAIEADPTQIRQVVMNLVTNASDALEDRPGTITITTGVMECDRGDLLDSYLREELPCGTYVYLEVADTGCGMNEETLSRIFDPFFTTKLTGRGLGLASVLGIVRGHRGTLRIKSRPHQGSTFTVLFPICDQAADREPVRKKAGAPSFASTMTVLVVDDEGIVRDLARTVLEGAGLEVLTARDGEEGIRVFGENKETIAAVLLDMSMPELSGEETYQKLRRLRADLPVILTSGYNEQDTVARLQHTGKVGFLQKPYLPSDLVAKVREALE